MADPLPLWGGGLEAANWFLKVEVTPRRVGKLWHALKEPLLGRR